MKFNYRKISAVIASAVMLGSSIGIAAAASYPDPFIKAGVADVAIVYGTGTGMSALDVVEAGNVQADLQSRMTAGTGGTTAVSSGEGTKIEQSSNRLNLGNGVTDVWGTSLTNTNMPIVLKSGSFYNKQNTEYKYDQKIDLSNMSFSHFSDSDYNDRKPALGFSLASNAEILNYTLTFVTAPESTAGTDLTDFENKNIQILGKEYFILDFKNSTAKITLLDSANTGTVAEGEAKEITVGDTKYTVKVSFISSNEVILNINGVDTDKLSETGVTYGNTYKMSDGIYVGIRAVNVQNYAGGSKTVDFSLGKGKLEITNGTTVKINDKSIQDLNGYIQLADSGTKRTWNKLIIEWRINNKAFLTPDKELLMPGFEAVKLSMAETTIPSKETTSIEYSGSDVLQVKTTIIDGEITLPLLYIDSSTGAVGGNITGIGQSATQRIMTSNFSVNDASVQYNASSGTPQYQGFIASWASARQAESHYLQFINTQYDSSVSTTSNVTTLYNKVTKSNIRENLKTGDSVSIGNVILKIEQIQVVSGTSERLVNVSIGAGGSFHTLYTKDGLLIWLPYAYNATSDGDTNKGSLQMNYSGVNFYNEGNSNKTSWVLHMSEADKDGTLAASHFNVTMAPGTAKKVSITLAQGFGTTTYPSGFETVQSSKVWEAYVVSDLATKLTWDKTATDQYEADIEYHGGQVYANVYVAEPAAVVSGGGTTTSTVTQLGTVVFKDSEIDSVKTKNIIVVGGSCINSVAANLLGGALCSAAFTEKTQVGSGQFLIESLGDKYTTGKIALLVAGYNAEDTQNAAKYLRTKVVDTTAGKKYIGTSATEATLQVA